MYFVNPCCLHTCKLFSEAVNNNLNSEFWVITAELATIHLTEYFSNKYLYTSEILWLMLKSILYCTCLLYCIYIYIHINVYLLTLKCSLCYVENLLLQSLPTGYGQKPANLQNSVQYSTVVDYAADMSCEHSVVTSLKIIKNLSRQSRECITDDES